MKFLDLKSIFLKTSFIFFFYVSENVTSKKLLLIMGFLELKAYF